MEYKKLLFASIFFAITSCSNNQNKAEERLIINNDLINEQVDTIVKEPVVESKEVVVEEVQEAEVVLPTGKPAPNFMLTSTEGKEVSLSELNENMVLLEFWFPGCKGCLLSIPMLNELQEKYKASGLKVYGIEHRDVSNQEVNEYMAKHNMQFPSLYQGKSVSKEYGVWLAPSFFLINKEGRIIYENSYSDKNKAKLIELIDQHLLVDT